MPNHVTNFIEFNCTDTKFVEIAEFVKREDGNLGSVDFNKLRPMPEELDIPSGTLGTNGLQLYKEYLAEIEGVTSKEKRDKIRSNYLNKSEDAPKALELGKKYYENIEKYGSPTWYEWCIREWGTKWNAYEYETWGFSMSVHKLGFCTAWSPVPNIVQLLSEKFPEVGMKYSWCDEDIGHNVGVLWFLGGQVENLFLPVDGSKDAFELSASIDGHSLAELGFKYNEETRTYEWDADSVTW